MYVRGSGWRRYAAAPIWVLSCLLCEPASAGSFQVSPIHISVPDSQPIGAITVRNEADEQVSVRVLTYKWTQENGQDVYSETSEMLASPPIFTLEARGSQVIRVGLRRVVGASEAAYRVILEEIPKAASDAAGIRVTLRLNLPFFKQPRTKGVPKVTWSAVRAKDGSIDLRATNGGTLHERFSRIDLAAGAGARSLLVEQPGVVLATSSKDWKVSARPVQFGRSMRLIVMKPGGEELVEVLVQDQP